MDLMLRVIQDRTRILSEIVIGSGIGLVLNRKRVSRSSYTGGIGFISPERKFHSYHTPRARYHRRPAPGPPSARSWTEDEEEGKEEGEEVAG